MMGWYGGGMGAGGWVGTGLVWVLLLGGIVWLVVQLSRSSQRKEAAATTTATRVPARPGALELLDRRLAAGEIDLAAYQQARSALLERGVR